MITKYLFNVKSNVFIKLSSSCKNIEIKKDNLDWLGDCACPNRTNLNPKNEELVQLKFKNRDYEIDLICNPGQPQLMVIGAPAGYGKTSLLNEVKERYKKDGWKCVLIPLHQIKGKYSIRNEIARQIQAQPIDIKNDFDADEILRSELIEVNRVLLLFDSIEQSYPEDLDWLLILVSKCKHWLKTLDFRTIFAGRYVNVSETKWLNYKKFHLTPFTEDIVKKVIEDTVEQYPLPTKQKPQDEDLKTWAHYITYLSGGHPKAIQNLVSVMKNRHYGLVFSQDELPRLFDSYVDKELDGIINALDDITREALETFSIFRLLTFNTIQSLQAENVFSNSINAQSIFTKLNNLGFIIKQESSPFFSDNIVRKLLMTKMKIFNSDRYKSLNKIAQKIYEKWIESNLASTISFGLSPKDLVPIYVQENIYHFFQQFHDKLIITEVVQFIKQQSKFFLLALGEDENDPNYRKKLENIFLFDQEICESLNERNLNPEHLLDIAFEQKSFKPKRVQPRKKKKICPQIFFSYASEDKEQVEQLYQKLLDAGFKPWMDTKDILPGERWEYSINKAVRESDFFIVCLSTNSVSKRGFLQKEIKNALNIWQEKLEEDIYLIPVRLEKCEVPESLKVFQWVDLFDDDWFSKLLKAINVGLERLQK